jgi:hypothetical protein
MLAPVFGPMALPCAALPQGMHCMRQSMSAHAASAHEAQPAMHCHHAMAQTEPHQPESSEASFQASNGNCCQNHCCCGATTSEWAQPASNLLSCLSLLIERARRVPSTELQSSDISGHDSARAPPRS